METKYGIIEYDNNGLPICKICGKSFKRVLTHVRQKHDVNEKEYKLQFGLDLHKGICSKESSEISRNLVFANYDKCISKNLLYDGKKTRFKINSEGRTKDKVSEQTRLRLIQNFDTPEITKKRVELGRNLGLSGLGNKKRWGNK